MASYSTAASSPVPENCALSVLADHTPDCMAPKIPCDDSGSKLLAESPAAIHVSPTTHVRMLLIANKIHGGTLDRRRAPILETDRGFDRTVRDVVIPSIMIREITSI